MMSMTGFGRYELINEQCKIAVEMKSVNHRYLDLSIKLPKKFNFFETAIRNLIKYDIHRGKVDMFITYEDYTEGRVSLKYNRTLAKEYMERFQEMEEEFHLENDIKVSTLARFPEVLRMEQSEDDEEELWLLIKEAVSQAVKKLMETRSREGEQLKEDLFKKLDNMETLVAQVEERSPQIIQEYRQKLEDKVKELLEGSGIDENRIAAEVVLFADKICVDEETVRLKSHITHAREALMNGGDIGRKLDFIAQEMNREANTILSKANDMKISEIAIGLKTEIEKVREQIQNIE